jgi:hypothetical protein
MNDALGNFRQRLADHGLEPSEILTDGSIHRFPTWGDTTGELSGAYWHNGRIGWFQDWRCMEKPEVVAGELSKEDKSALNGSFAGANRKVSTETFQNFKIPTARKLRILTTCIYSKG